MVSKEQDELISRIGPATFAGKLIRLRWRPVALAHRDGAAVPNFIPFRDPADQYGLREQTRSLPMGRARRMVCLLA
jgi:hypothetical protein